ncbi:hypothetical protein CMO93_02735 [Candidatus Woesearchaeota archaeon]|nr:hypothetical protein [Candidatus Woesearchaeota archaeon]|tara:strand:- start:1870 stop:2436 length:567 start_codon:yes stop_codon:yes gene_type:complete
MNPLPFVHKVTSTPADVAYVQYKGVWDMQDLYEFVASFFSKSKFKFYEKKYIHKRPGPFGPETYHVWEARKDEEEYYRTLIDLFLHTYDTQDIEVTMKDGTKKTFTKGRLWIQIKGTIQLDYEKRWEEKAFYANLRNFYHKYVIWKKIEAIWWDKMHYTLFLRLHSLIKERLKMEADAYEHRYFHKVR